MFRLVLLDGDIGDYGLQILPGVMTTGMGVFRQTRIRKNLARRADILRAVAEYFDGRGFMAVETPVRIAAPAPEAHIDPQPSGGWFLRASPELCMKRLLAAGYPALYQIGKCFRKGERGALHLPEMTLLEWYAAHADYKDLMTHCEQLLSSVAAAAGCGETIRYQKQVVRLTAPWERMTVQQAFERYAPVSMATALAQDRFDDIIALDIAPHLGRGRPLFLYDYPLAHASLARQKAEAPHLAERFELYIAGMELANGFSELTDPVEQRRRFTAEHTLRRRTGKPPQPMPEAFLQALAHMPPAAGCALGIDRLVMLLTDAAVIDAVVAFTPEES